MPTKNTDPWDFVMQDGGLISVAGDNAATEDEAWKRACWIWLCGGTDRWEKPQRVSAQDLARFKALVKDFHTHPPLAPE